MTTTPIAPHSKASGAENLRRFGELKAQGLTARQIGHALGVSDNYAYYLAKKWRARQEQQEAKSA